MGLLSRCLDTGKASIASGSNRVKWMEKHSFLDIFSQSGVLRQLENLCGCLYTGEVGVMRCPTASVATLDSTFITVLPKDMIQCDSNFRNKLSIKQIVILYNVVYNV